MGQLQIRVLGSPEVRHDGRALKFRSRKVLALLLYLAVEGHRVTREKISAMLWPKSDEVAARATLRRTLADLRTALDEGPAGAHLLIERDALAFALTPGDELDIHTVNAAFDLLRRPLPAREQAAERHTLLRQLQQAAQVVRGAFLEDFAPGDAPEFDEWIGEQRAVLQRRISLIFERLAHLQAEQGDVPAAIETANSWLAHDPFEETAYQRLMVLYLAAGNYSAALNAFESCRRMLIEEQGSDPLPETLALAERIRRAAGSALTLGKAGTIRSFPSPARQGEFSAIESAHQQTAPVLQVVGRSREHLALVELYRQVRQGRGAHIAIISGEAGIGKTRLAREFVGWAGAQGVDILQARAFETGGRLPYQPLVESLRPRLERENAPEDLLSDAWLAELTRLFPELRDRYPDLPAATGDETTARVRLYEAIVRLGQALAERQPVILWLDDLHWADAATLDVLYYAARRWKESLTALLLLLNLRSDSLIEWLAALQRDVGATTLPLAALTFEETQRVLELLALNVEQDGQVEVFARWLFAQTGGQPFYITETLKALLERGLLARVPQSDGGWRVDFQRSTFNETALRRFLPTGVREVIRVRLNQLAPDSFALLAAGAVLGRDASFEELCRVAGLDEQAGLRALDELLRNRFLREGAGAALLDPQDEAIFPTTYFFAHDKVRDVVYSEAGDARRRVFHRRALEGLQMAPAAEKVRHALAAGLHGQAFSLYEQAGDEAMQMFAVNDAGIFYERALRLLPGIHELVPLPTIQHVYTQLGRAYELTNRAEQAECLYRDMLTHAQQMHTIAMECVALSRMAILAVQVRLDLEQANMLLQSALGRAEQANDRTLIADIEWHLAQLGFYDFDAPTIITHSQRSLAIAREQGLTELMARGLNVLSYGKKQSGQLNEAEIYAREAVTLFQTIGNRAMAVDSMCVIADIMLNQGRIEEGIALAQTAYDVSLHIGNAWSQVNSMYHLAFGRLERGAVAEALVLAERCVALTEEFKLQALQVNSYILLGIVQRAAGAVDAACTTHQTALRLGQQIPSSALIAAVAVELCADYAMLGQWEESQAFAFEAATGKSDLFVLVFGLRRWYVTEALVRAGQVELATEDLARWKERVEESLRHRISYLRAVAILARAQGQNDRATTALQEALAFARALHLISEQKDIEAALRVE